MLTVRVTPKPGSETTTWKLTCAPAGGNHPHAKQACAAIKKAKHPFAPVSKKQMCTQIYGGPQRARITGSWQGQKIDADFSRKNGCQISRWKALRPVLKPGAPSHSAPPTGSPD